MGAGWLLCGALSLTSSHRALLLTSKPQHGPARTTKNTPQANLFDIFKESEAKKKAKEEAWQAQQQILARRRDPELMQQYEDNVRQRRRNEAASDAELRKLQNSDSPDNLEQWKELAKEGKVKTSQTAERDADSRRLGSEGLVGERMDVKLPYIDRGYVDEGAPDLMKELGKMFGNKESD